MMGLTLSQQKAVTRAIGTRYRRASKADNGVILASCAQRPLGIAVMPVRPWRRPCGRPWCGRLAGRGPRVYGPEVVAALRFCWAVLGAPTVQRLAPVMAELVPTLRRFAELEVSDEVAAGLVVIAASTMDRRRAPDRAAMSLRGRSHTKPALHNPGCSRGLKPPVSSRDRAM